MALNFSRILCRRNLKLNSIRCLYTSNASNISTTVACLKPVECETQEERNLRFKRPLSPHLTIYKPQLTSMLSVTHRGTGIIVSIYAALLGLGTLFIPGGIPCLIHVITNWNLSPAALTAGKFLLAFPFTYHYINGIRHLTWDLGKLLSIKQIYTTGWIMLGLSVISAVVLAVM